MGNISEENNFLKFDHYTSSTRAIFSVILLAYADADTLLATLSVGDSVNSNDGSAFRTSTLEEMLEKRELHISFPTSLPLTAAKHLLIML
jgi:putative lipase involved disintegration of autophagic bodies